MEDKSILSEIIPFYEIIEDICKTGTSILRIKVQASEERKTLKQRIEFMEKQFELADRSVARQIQFEQHRVELADRSVARQIQFEQHRVELFERVKRLEIAIKQEIFEFQLEAQQRLMNLYEELKEKLVNESTRLLIEKLPDMLLIAQNFEQQPEVYQQYKERIFRYIDSTIKSIEQDQQMFRTQIAELHMQQSNMTALLIKISENFQLPYTNHPKMLENE